VSEAVVDELEVVEIDEEHRHAVAVAVGPGERETQVVLERDAVREVGQGIVMRQVLQPLLGLYPLGDIAD